MSAIDPSLLCCLLWLSCNNIGSNDETNYKPKQHRLTDGNLVNYSFFVSFLSMAENDDANNNNNNNNSANHNP